MRALVVFAALGMAGFAQSVLPVNETYRGRLEPGQPQSFIVDLKVNDAVEVTVEQTGVDVNQWLYGPDGAEILRKNYLGQGGKEALFYVAGQAGRHRMELHPVWPGQGGEFSLLARVHPASSDDRELSAANVELANLVRGKSADPQVLEKLASRFQQSGAAYHQAVALTEAAVFRYRKNSLDAAIRDALAAQKLWQGLKERAGQGRALCILGAVYSIRSDFPPTSRAAEACLAIGRDLGDKALEASALQLEGGVFTRTGEPTRAMTLFEQVLRIRRELGDREGQIGALNGLAYANFALSQHLAALPLYEQALSIARELNLKQQEAGVLNGIAIVDRELSRYQEGIETYQKALALAREVQDDILEATILGNLGLMYSTVGKYSTALKYHEQSRAVHLKHFDMLGVGFQIGCIGLAYRGLGQYTEALRYYEEALKMSRAGNVPVGEGMVLNEIAAVYLKTGRYKQAIVNLEQALAIERKIKNRAVEGWVQNSLGNAYLRLKQPQTALEHYEASLEIAREIKDRATEGDTLNNIGAAYLMLKKESEAAAYSEQALAIARQVKNRNNEHDALLSLMRVCEQEKQPRLAIFYGKQAVNVVQTLRAENPGLSQESRASFITSKRDTFRVLANLLVSEGRLLEAQQVLRLLKEQELFDFIRREESAAGSLGRADLTADETAWATRFRQTSEVLVARGAQMEDLRARMRQDSAVRESPETQRLLAELQKDLEAGNLAFQEFLRELRQHFAAKPDRSGVAISLKESEALKSDLGDLKHGAVAIYTLLAPDRYVAILVTTHVQRAYETRITPEALNAKILAFRESLEQPKSNPLPAAQELYRILVPPALEKDLKQAKAETLMWSLDGPLRYLPVAALHDGRRYMVEQYRTAVFTSASNARLKDAPQPQWRGLAFGVTQSHPGFDPLPAVASELQSIIREKQDEQGILEGRRLLDDQFTRAALDRELSAGYPVVHLATHFQFRPGDETHSFLLLGDGGQLTLADLKAADSMFSGVDLLTLSACSTGLGSLEDSDGSEVEGFGALAQRKGAKSVVASLWSVADRSTAALMREFYRIRQANPGVTKIEALRQAQLTLLRNRTSISSGTRGVTLPGGQPAANDAAAGWSHPYYWAPFFLMGNWL